MLKLYHLISLIVFRKLDGTKSRDNYSRVLNQARKSRVEAKLSFIETPSNVSVTSILGIR